MKLWIKIGLAAAGISAVLGTAGIVTGLCMGADFKNLEKTLPEASFREIYNKIGHVERSSLKNQTEFFISSHEIEQLKIEAESAKITICKAKNDDITYCSNRNREIAKREGTTWKIEDCDSFGENLELTLFLPAKVFQEINIEVSACEMYAECLSADTISLECDAAAVVLQEVWVSQCAKLQMDAGSLEVEYFAGPKLEAECDMGSMHLICAGEYEDYNYRMECDMGTIVVENSGYSVLENSFLRDHGSDKVIEAECNMGEIVIGFE